MSELVVHSQKKMRDYASEQIERNFQALGTEKAREIANISSYSCVSQRDIQRVFIFYKWFKDINREPLNGESSEDMHTRAILIALGIVYYMRLNNHYRNKYAKSIDSSHYMLKEKTFLQVFNEEIDRITNNIVLPNGIARTQALKENIFAVIACTVTQTPLIIVGAPGCSKTLSFNQTIANLKGEESKNKMFRNTRIFPSLDPHYYQCSRRTTSNEIDTVFSRAINRQKSHIRFKLPVNCVVFMDEAGLPEESHESLKILHYHLDKQEVSFVAITNHILDAAKTNRAVSLFRPNASHDDLQQLVEGCFSSGVAPRAPGDIKLWCSTYTRLMSDNPSCFGLRDFIHFLSYLRRKCDEKKIITSQLILQAIERNFNGLDNFDTVCKSFLGDNLQQVTRRDILDILRASLEDRPQEKQDLGENEVRYKLIIDPSEDDSLVRLLFTFAILKRENTRVFVCSDFPADGHLQKINTIAAIRHSAMEGHTVVMSQTDDIHESFYDLFNQRFRKIHDPKDGPRYYTNVAIGAHLKPSRVHPNFQCVVVVKKSAIANTPAPFLNRFEKYHITHKTLLDTTLSRLPPFLATITRTALTKVMII